MRNRRQFNLKALIKKLLGKQSSPNPNIQKLYEKHDYLDAYSKHTDQRVDKDPKSAVGGMWEEMGQLQFDFLVKHGLKPHHTMLDIGCGTLRGGRHFIRYLNPQNYSGMDISPKAIAFAKQLVTGEGLTDKHPQLLLSEDKNLKFEMFSNQTFDFLFAQSVFTHLPTDAIEECFQHIGTIMHDKSVFFFTFFASGKPEQRNLKDFAYPYSFFEGWAPRYGFSINGLCGHVIRHPRNP